jgi:hypothetical protein
VVRIIQVELQHSDGCGIVVFFMKRRTIKKTHTANNGSWQKNDKLDTFNIATRFVGSLNFYLVLTKH